MIIVNRFTTWQTVAGKFSQNGPGKGGAAAQETGKSL
jgi:hypothetical protein